MEPIKLTPLQYHFVHSNEDSVSLNAKAGSGKTHSVFHRIKHLEQSGKLPDCTAILSFNKDIQKEWKSKDIPDHIHVCTAHSLGYRLLREVASGNVGDVMPNKYQVSDWAKLTFDQMKVLEKIRQEYILHENDHSFLKDQILKEMSLNMNIAKPDLQDAINIYNVWKKGISKLGSTIDYQDMVTGAMEMIAQNPKFEKNLKTKFDLVIVDEVQDFNKHFMRLVDMVEPSSIIVAGDNFQTINIFNNASPHSMGILESKFSAKKYFLNESRRCPSSVSGHISKYMNFDFVSSSTIGRGTFEPLEQDQNPAHFDLSSNPRETCFLSRWNSSLVRTGLFMVKNNIKFQYKKDVTQPLIWKIRKAGKGSSPTLSIHEYLKNVYEERISELEKDGLEMSNQEFDIHDACISMTSPEFAKMYPKVSDLTKALSLMGKNKSGFVLSTVHASKGLEYDNVIFLDTKKLRLIAEAGPKKIDKQTGSITRLPENEESNIYYVGCTRTKKNLCFRDSEHFQPQIV